MAKRASIGHDQLYIDGINVNRAGKFLFRQLTDPNFKMPIDIGQTMELLVKSFGYESLYAARKEAKENVAPQGEQHAE